MWLLDTNIVLEVLLDQAQAADAEELLRSPDVSPVLLSDFSLYSLGIVLTRRGRQHVFGQVIRDLFDTGRVRLARLGIEQLADVTQAALDHGLDFDDAYQYTLARQMGLRIVSFDAHFDRTDLGRATPAEVLAESTAADEQGASAQ